MKIETKDTAGVPNGWLLPVWNSGERPDLRPDQVYVTAIAPGCRKGPHLHMKRRGMFACVAGSVRIVYVDSVNKRWSAELVPGSAPFVVNPGSPCALYNFGETEALVINMPSPAWSKEQPDDWPVEFWTDPEGWPVSL